MATDAFARRRRAALAVFGPLLDNDALIDALWQMQENVWGEAVTDIIRYTDQVAERALIDGAARKRLYEALYKALRADERDLPPDPWPAMQQARPGRTATTVVPLPTRQPVHIPAPSIPAPAPPPPPPEPPPPDHQAVFAALITTALLEVQQFHPGAQEELRQDMLREMAQARLSGPVRQAVRDALSQPECPWRVNASPAELSELTHAFYIALCHSLGPVEADDVLTQAVGAAERLPAARRFPPGQLL